MGFSLRSIIRQELEQRREEGCDTEPLERRIQAALEDADGADSADFEALYDFLDGLEPAATFPYDEPSDLTGIRALRPEGPRHLDVKLSDDDLLDRIHGAWLGRAAGCTLGKPVEGWSKANIDSYLSFNKALPLDDYLPYSEDHPDGLVPRSPECTRGRIEAMERDDDMDYPILGLLLLEEKGLDFTSRRMANTWLSYLPYQLVYTAENAALVTDDIDRIIEVGLSEIPATCRLAEAVRDTVAWCSEESDWELVWSRINERYGHYNGVHTINNAALVVMGLLFGADDYETGIVVAVRAGWDTDCNGATVGSILGARSGGRALPAKWVGVLNDRLLSIVRGCNENRISDLAERTFKVAKRIQEEGRKELGPADAGRMPAFPRVDRATEGAAGSSASSLVGSWTLISRWGGVETQHSLVVHPDLTGRLTYERWGGVNDLPKVVVEGDAISFDHRVSKGSWEMDVRFEGFVRGDTITGDFFTGVGATNVAGIRDFID